MKNLRTWAVLLAALMLTAGCRPTEETDIPGATEPTAIVEEEGTAVCVTGENDCGEEPAAEETAVEQVERPTTAPTEQTAPEPTAETTVNSDEDPFAIRDTDWVKGPDDAFITLIEYGDFQ